MERLSPTQRRLKKIFDSIEETDLSVINQVIDLDYDPGELSLTDETGQGARNKMWVVFKNVLKKSDTELANDVESYLRGLFTEPFDNQVGGGRWEPEKHYVAGWTSLLAGLCFYQAVKELSMAPDGKHFLVTQSHADWASQRVRALGNERRRGNPKALNGWCAF